MGRCTQAPAKGFDCCRFHGARQAMAALKHGKYAKHTYVMPLFGEELERHLSNPAALKDLGPEISFARILIEKRLEAAKARASMSSGDTVEVTEYATKRIAELSRLVSIAKMKAKGAEMSTADKAWYKEQRIAEAITPVEEQSLRDSLRIIGDLVAKKSKIEDGVKHTVTVSEMGFLTNQLKVIVAEAVRDAVGDEKAEAVEKVIGEKVAQIRRMKVSA